MTATAPDIFAPYFAGRLRTRADKIEAEVRYMERIMGWPHGRIALVDFLRDRANEMERGQV
jgi:hypothetical protein